MPTLDEIREALREGRRPDAKARRDERIEVVGNLWNNKSVTLPLGTDIARDLGAWQRENLGTFPSEASDSRDLRRMERDSRVTSQHRMDMWKNGMLKEDATYSWKESKTHYHFTCGDTVASVALEDMGTCSGGALPIEMLVAIIHRLNGWKRKPNRTRKLELLVTSALNAYRA